MINVELSFKGNMRMSSRSYSQRRAITLASMMASLVMAEQAVAAPGPIAPALLAFAGLLYTTVEFVGAVGLQESTGLGGSWPWQSLLLAVLLPVMGSAALVHLVDRSGEQNSSGDGSDTPSLILIAIICGLCLLSSVWAACSGTDLGAYLI